MSNASTTPVTVRYATAAATAAAGTDYLSASGTLTFAPGVMTQTVTLYVIGDRTRETNETFQLVLSSAVGATIGGSGTVTIIDDEKALTAAAAPALDIATPIDDSTLQTAAREAMALWLTDDPTATFDGIVFELADLPGLLLGLTTDRTITIDPTAAGWGWSRSDRDAWTSFDLVTVLLHELGHILGRDHDSDANNLMAETLTPGIRDARHTPGHDLADANGLIAHTNAPDMTPAADANGPIDMTPAAAHSTQSARRSPSPVVAIATRSQTVTAPAQAVIGLDRRNFALYALAKRLPARAATHGNGRGAFGKLRSLSQKAATHAPRRNVAHSTTSTPSLTSANNSSDRITGEKLSPTAAPAAPPMTECAVCEGYAR
jgi:hypothetical protein